MEKNTIILSTGSLNVLLCNGFKQGSQLAIDFKLFPSFEALILSCVYLFAHCVDLYREEESLHRRKGRKVCTQYLENKGENKKKSMHVI